MAELTPFGKALRKLRIEYDLRLFDLARVLDVSSAFISAIETGRKTIPDGFVTRISNALSLREDETRELRSAADKTRKEVKVERLSETDRELVAAFARRLDDIPDDMLEQLKAKLLKSMFGEQPFKRQRRGIIVPAMSYTKLMNLADKVRSLFVNDSRIDFPIIEVLEHKMERIFPNYVFEVWENSEMGRDEGRVTIGGSELILRLDVYEAACRGDGRARFTASHELCHYLLHRNISFARARDETDKIYCDSEWQADVFAGSLLMSSRHTDRFSGATHAAEMCLMTQSAAQVMWSKYVKDGVIRPQASLF
ncbi:MAG TPA: XRE family transcriptional regulator [Methylocystis sp.]|jgi:transcriptional regulator with XRE-family HTH domain